MPDLGPFPTLARLRRTATTTMSAAVVFDIETHILQRYVGEARIQRLICVACIDPSLRESALATALKDSKHKRNVPRCREIYNLLQTPPDDAWIQEAEDQNRREHESLKAKLSLAQAHLNKEAIRAAHAAIAEHALETGDLTEALHSENKAKDHCTSLRQIGEHTKQCLALNIYIQQYLNVPGIVMRLRNSGQTSKESHIAMGISEFALGKYVAAAKCFTEASSCGSVETPGRAGGEAGTAGWDETVLSPEDLALYTTVLTLLQNRSQALALAEHAVALEAAPILRDILLQFHKFANYHAASRLLESHVWPILRYDPLFQARSSSGGGNLSHFDRIIAMIRIKAIGEFWKPYSSCPLPTMQESLGTTLVGSVEELQTTVLDLLMNRRDILPPDTRYDFRNSTLVRDVVVDQSDSNNAKDPVAAVARKIQDTSRKTLDETYSMMIRVACMENESRRNDLKKRRNNWNGPFETEMDEEVEDTEAMMIDSYAMNPEDRY